MCDIICTKDYITYTLSNQTTVFMMSHPLRASHHKHSVTYRTHCICVITPTLSIVTQLAYVSYHIQYTCDFLSTVFITSYPLLVTTQNCVLLIPHSAYVWHPSHYRWYHIHSITPNHSIYDVTSTSGMISVPLYQTLHALYLSHQKLSTDIIPTFVWHHTHYLCDIICTL